MTSEKKDPPAMTLGMVIVNKGNNKITELRTITVNKTMSSLYDNIHVFVIVSKPMSLLPLQYTCPSYRDKTRVFVTITIYMS